jgi:hypothetical protein
MSKEYYLVGSKYAPTFIDVTQLTDDERNTIGKMADAGWVYGKQVILQEKMIPAQVPYAMGVIVKALQEDKSEMSLYGGFKTSIGRSFIDAMHKAFKDKTNAPSFEEMVQIASDAANDFLESLCSSPERKITITKP